MIDYEAQHTVYLHRDADGQIIYVGCTVDLEQRTLADAAWTAAVAADPADYRKAQR